MWNPWANDDDDEGPGFYFPNFFGDQDSDDDDEAQTLSPKASRVFFALFIVLLLALLAFFYLLYRFLSPLLAWVWQHTTSLSGQAFVTLLLLALAGGLFWLRENRRILYGSIELCFGIISTWEAVGQAQMDYAKWVAVVAAVYLVVRGLDNVVTGYRRYREHATPAPTTGEAHT